MDARRSVEAAAMKNQTVVERKSGREVVVTRTFGGDEELLLDARLPGVAAGALAIWRRAPIVLAMAIAAAVTAVARLV